ncbi:hypothetical protein HII36_24895 [Nonomuraea sp. NN258]|uniref:hypothetical protein n=1 Tax=Nonomuraea antri TaxID=2730852 RepID=UPI0015693721|nr:hypothetical protein [Nonomuraea antri]NRQ35035.1 hypothetical protein [Nonomuraea antri]
MKRFAAALGVGTLIALAGCQAANQEGGAMTPEQSRQKLIGEVTSVLEELIPDVEVKPLIRGKDLPCGGPYGTEDTSLRSSIEISTDAGLETSDPAIVTKARMLLEEKGWSISRTGRDGDQVELAIEKAGTGRGSFGVRPDYVIFNGVTLCVDNPES